MKFTISSQILEKYPQLRVGAVIARGINNSQYNGEIQEMIRKLVEEKRQKINPESVSQIPAIAKWREIYESFGAKSRDYKNSVEALIKRILKKDPYKINPLVDIYNYISIKYAMTVGGEDLSTMDGDLVLDFALGNEEFTPLGEKDNSPPWKGEVVYKDNKGVICRCWNWREGDRTKLSENTKNAVIVIENMIPSENEKLSEALNELRQLISKYCGGESEIRILSKENLSMEL